MPLGKVFVLEGGEGAGKSTHLARLKTSLDPEKFRFVREPGGTRFGESIRALLMSPGMNLSADEQFMLFMTSRFGLFGRTIRSEVLAGKNVVFDRMDASTYAYQIVAFGGARLEEMFWAMRKYYLSYGQEPEIEIVPTYIYLEVDPEVGLARANSEGREQNHYDKLTLDFHRRVKDGYEQFFTHVNPIRVNAGLHESAVYHLVSSIIVGAADDAQSQVK